MKVFKCKTLLFFMLLFLNTSVAFAGVKGVIGLSTSGPRSSLVNSLVSGWKLNENRTDLCTSCWVDSKGTNHLSNLVENDPFMSGGTDRNGLANAALSIGASTDFETFLLHKINPTPPQGSAFSLSIWINRTSSVNTNQEIYSNFSTTGGFHGVLLQVASNVLDVSVGFLTDPTITFTGTTTMALSTWYNVILTYDGTNLRLYLDNVLEGAPVSATGDIGSATELTIGGFTRAGGDPTTYFTGLLDDVLLWDRAITSTERAAVFTLGSDFTGTGL